MDEPSEIKVGDYVLATKYKDGDPGDAWGVGFYHSSFDHFGEQRHLIIDSAGKQIRHGGFRRVGHITAEYGTWVLSVSKHLEGSPPGTVNLWGMMGVRAVPQQDEEPPR